MKKEYNGIEKRQYLRVRYKPEERPKLKIGGLEFDVTDISEGGIRFINDKEIRIEDVVQGTLTFLNGESIGVEGNVVWEQDDSFGVNLTRLIPSGIIINQQSYHTQRLNQNAIKAPYRVVTK